MTDSNPPETASRTGLVERLIRDLKSPLVRRYLATVAPSVAAIAIAVVAAAGWLQYVNQRQQLKSEAQALAEMEAQALERPIWAMDNGQIAAQMTVMVNDRRYLAARVTTDLGRTFIHGAQRGKGDAPPQLNGKPITDVAAFVVGADIKRTVEGETRQIGRLQIYVTDRHLWGNLVRDVAVIAAVVALLLVALAVAALRVLRHQIFTPIERLIDAMHAIRRGRWTRVKVPGDDELSKLSAAFNEMVAKLEEGAAAQRQLAESEERYALAIAGSHDGIWDWNRVSGELYLSARWKELLGYRDDEIPNNIQEWLARIHASDRKLFNDALNAHLRGETEIFSVEHRMRHRDGTWRWMLARGAAVRDEAGTPTRIAGSLADIHERKTLEQQLVHDALHDQLSNLPNRALLLDRVDMALHRRARTAPESRWGVAILFIDLDRFQLVNDSLGHLTGDELLKQAAQRLVDCVRATDTVARLGGDEFVVLLEGTDVAELAEGIVSRIQEVFKRPFELGEREVYTSASVGIAVADESHESAADLLRDADTAMYEAKGAGRGSHAVFDHRVRRQALKTLELDTALRNAVDSDEIEPFFQPIVDLQERRIIGFEALARWVHPERGLVPPDEFIPLAEETGLIGVIGRRILRKALTQLRNWQALSQDLYMSVNVSPPQWLEHDFASEVAAAIRDNDLTPAHVRLETTESGMMRDFDRIGEALKEGAAHGVTLLIDDFGTGHSSLAELLRTPFHGLKIDKSFVHTRGATQVAQPTFVKTILGLANASDMFVIAEGVETEEQAQELLEAGCRYAQGYLFSKPVNSEGIEDLLLDELARGWNVDAVAS